jgi:lysophospholipase L1-like esterase
MKATGAIGRKDAARVANGSPAKTGLRLLGLLLAGTSLVLAQGVAPARTPVLRNLNAAQQAEFDRIAPDLVTAATTARSELAAASLRESADPAVLTQRAEALAAAETALALARAETLARLQASPNRLGAPQIATVVQSAGRGRGAVPAAPAGRGAAAPAVVPVQEIQRPAVAGLIPAGDPRIRYMGRWDTRPEGAITVNSGSSLLLRFEGRTLQGIFQPVGSPPQIYVTVDGAEKRLLNVDQAALELAPALSGDGPHTLVLEVKDVNQNTNRWTPPLQSALIFLGVVPGDGGRLLDPTAALTGRWAAGALRMAFYGDSITEGVRAISLATGPEGSDGTRNYSYLTGLALGANITEVGFGAQGILRGGGGGVPAAGAAFPFNFAGSPRDAATPDPQVVVINQGTNDSGASPTVFEPAYLAFLQQVRAAHPRALIAAMRPFNGSQDAAIHAAVQAMRDPRVIYIDTDGWLELTNSPDYTEQPTGLHPSLAGHAKAARLLTEALVAAGVTRDRAGP